MVWEARSITKTWLFPLRPGMEKDRDEVIHKLIDIQYSRNDMDFKRGSFRVRGDVLEAHTRRIRAAMRTGLSFSGMR